MSRVLILSTTFPSYHPKKGKPTFFVEALYKCVNPAFANNFYFYINDFEPKGHTIRSGHRYKVGDKFSPRIWSGKPYQTKQITLCDDITVLKVWNFKINARGYWLNGRLLNYRELKVIAANDGLSLDDFELWFAKYKLFDGQIICWSDSIQYYPAQPIKRSQRDSRRYYLHRAVKRFAAIDVQSKTISIPTAHEADLSPRQAKYLNNIRSLGYVIQNQIEVKG